MCGIIALLLADHDGSVAPLLVDGLGMIQHRGQDAAGIITAKDGRLHLRKDAGLIRNVFQRRHIAQLAGHFGIGHCRYPTAGSSSTSEAQPFYTNTPYGICLAHNGNLVNADEIHDQLTSNTPRHINTSSDSELLLNVLADEILRLDPGRSLGPSEIFAAVQKLNKRCHGGYSAVALINNHGILAFRDKDGIRPLVFGSRKGGKGVDYAFASESVAFDVLGFSLTRDVKPGEAIFINTEGQARLEMGEELANQIIQRGLKDDLDVVIPIPDTARTSALQMATVLGLPYREGFIKNRYIARTFIMPGQATRKKAVKLKLNVVRSVFHGKRVLLVDDSIVRGTTSEQLVALAREAGAKAVYLASAAPAIRHPNVYGIDMPLREELVAYGRTEEEIAQVIGADWVMFQNLEDLEARLKKCFPVLEAFENSCFSGKYVTDGVSEQYFEHLRRLRADSVLAAKNQWLNEEGMAEDNIDLYQAGGEGLTKN